MSLLVGTARAGASGELVDLGVLSTPRSAEKASVLISRRSGALLPGAGVHPIPVHLGAQPPPVYAQCHVA